MCCLDMYLSACERIYLWIYYCLQTKLREGNIFTGVCDSVHRGFLVPGGGVPAPRGVWSTEGACSGGCLLLGGSWSQGGPGGGPPMATAAGSMHPTGIHSCYFWIYGCLKLGFH